MADDKGYSSQWVVDRKVYEGALYRLQFTACGNPRCRQGCPGPTHGPYWFKLVRVKDGRDFLRYVGKEPPWPEDQVPPSVLPADDDPKSRRSLRRQASERRAAKKAARKRTR